VGSSLSLRSFEGGEVVLTVWINRLFFGFFGFFGFFLVFFGFSLSDTILSCVSLFLYCALIHHTGIYGMSLG